MTLLRRSSEYIAIYHPPNRELLLLQGLRPHCPIPLAVANVQPTEFEACQQLLLGSPV